MSGAIDAHDPDAVTRSAATMTGAPALNAKDLRQRTLTNLYNQRPTWLANAHDTLDAAVSAAYGWPVNLEDTAILERLLNLNLQRGNRG